MKSAILYATSKPPIAAGEYTRVAKTFKGEQIHIWIRVAIVGADCAHALNMAKPRTDETVMNTIEL